MYLSTDRKKWRAFVKAAINLWGFTNGGEFLDQLHKGNQYAKIQQNALKLFIISLNSTYMFRPAPAIFRVGVIKYQVQCSKRV